MGRRNGKPTANGAGHEPLPAETAPHEAPQQQPNGQEKNQPVHRIRIRSVSAAIWLNQSDRGPYYTATYSRSYRDQQGNWHSTESFNGPDSLLLAEVARAAFHWIVNATQSGSSQTQQNGPSANGNGHGGDAGSDIPF